MELTKQEVTLDQFNKFFNDQYAYLVKNAIETAKKVNNNYNTGLTDQVAKDSIHDAYIKIKKRLDSKPFYGNITGFTLVSINNTIKTIYNKENKLNKIDYNNDIYTDIIETALSEITTDDNTKQTYLNDLEIISSNIFKYLELNYNEVQIFIFKMYYLNPKMTYKKVHQTTKYSMGYISQTMKQIKIDLRNNFLDWFVQNRIY